MISARIRSEHAAALDSLVAELKAAGWAVEKYHILEFALRPLLSSSERGKILADLNTAKGGPPRGVMSSRIRDEYKQALQEASQGSIEQYHLLEHLLSELLTPEGKAAFVNRLGQTPRWD